MYGNGCLKHSTPKTLAHTSSFIKEEKKTTFLCFHAEQIIWVLCQIQFEDIKDRQIKTSPPRYPCSFFSSVWDIVIMDLCLQDPPGAESPSVCVYAKRVAVKMMRLPKKMRFAEVLSNNIRCCNGRYYHCL